jgi:hypothetical protein
VGWSFTIVNTADYLVVTGSSFTPSSLYGTYQDYIGTHNFVVVGPAPESTTVSQAFNISALTGVGAFTVNSTAPSGIKISGNLTIDYSLFSQDPNDPNFDPGASLVVADATLTQPATVNIIPEPASALLLAVGLFSLCAGLAHEALTNECKAEQH